MDFELYRLPQTIFTFREISLMFPKISGENLRSRLYYLVKTKKLISLRRGIYAKPNYSIYELGNKIYRPSYISLQTGLEKNGIIFQPHNAVFFASYLSRKITVAGTNFVYRKIKEPILLNPTGVYNENGVAYATKERAFLDTVLLYKDYYVDNFDGLDKDKIKELLPIYQNKALERRVKKYV